MHFSNKSVIPIKQFLILSSFVIALAALFLPFLFEPSEDRFTASLDITTMPQTPALPKQDKILALMADNNQIMSREKSNSNAAWVIKLGHFEEQEATRWLNRLSQNGFDAFLKKQGGSRQPELFIGPNLSHNVLESLANELDSQYGFAAEILPFTPGT